MKIAMLGLGKLGLPVIEQIRDCGHEVMGYDIRPVKCNIPKGTLGEVVRWADIVFASPQTPHDKRFEGDDFLLDDKKDFDYSYLIKLVKDVVALKVSVNLAVISTCLPGTFKREIEPLLSKDINYIYNPFFIAMGTVKQDFLDPEFVLLGGKKSTLIEKFYRSIHDKPLLWTDITTAEAIKLSYNTFITMKTVLGNIWGEIAHKVGANFDDIHKAWSLSTDRLISSKYLRAGVGDGGGCHPRDNIALSWLANEVGLSHDIFRDLMEAREDHMAWIAEMAQDLGQPIIILGRSFKPETTMEDGSPAVLLANLIHNVTHVEDLKELPVATYVIGTQHQRYKDYNFPKGSRVLDPFRYIPDKPGVTVVRIGDAKG